MISRHTAEVLLDRSRQRSVWLAPESIPLLLIGIVAGAVIARPDWLGENSLAAFLLPQAVLLSILVWLWRRTRLQKRTSYLATAVWEAIRLKDWPQAESLVSELLARPIRSFATRAQSLMALVAVAEEQQQYDAAQHVLEAILMDPQTNAGQRFVAQVALAGTLLRTQQLTDAVNLIERLARVGLPEPLRAQIELLSLLRYVVMGQTDDAVAQADERCAMFRRHLGTRAGYGYGLLSVAFDRAGQPERAAAYWRDATLLLRADEIVHRFAEAQPVAEKYPATEWPL
ncbi:MAG: hypothetical protein JXA69_18030 [Phycisphaerae bacterium]|nr:hypothetical protein [Phycisphaerae bacterium]